MARALQCRFNAAAEVLTSSSADFHLLDELLGATPGVLPVAREVGLPAPSEMVIVAVEAADCLTVGGRKHLAIEAGRPGGGAGGCMGDPRTFWLIVSNVVLAVLVVLAIVGVATGAICEFMARRKQHHSAGAELDRDMQNLFGLSRHLK